MAEQPAEPSSISEPTSAVPESPAAPVQAETVSNEDAADTGSPAAPAVSSAAESAPSEGSASSETDEMEPPTDESLAPGSDMITVAPGVGDSQYTTTSIVTTTGTEKSVKKRRGMSKIDAANVYVYGHVEEPWQRRDIKPSTDLDVTVRPNRAQTMRQSCIMKRTKDMEKNKPKPRRALSESSSEDDDMADMITARKVPKNVYDPPKVPIKETKSSKFRYLFNRKPDGVKVYFKPANADPKKKPPFVVIAHP